MVVATQVLKGEHYPGPSRTNKREMIQGASRKIVDSVVFWLG